MDPVKIAEEELRRQRAANNPANKDKAFHASQGYFYSNLGKEVARNMKAPGLDTGLYDQASGYLSQAQQQNAKDMERYKQLMEGRGSLGATQAIAGAKQAANAQTSLANSSRGGLYGQAAAGQQASSINNTGILQGAQQAKAIQAILTDEQKEKFKAKRQEAMKENN